MKQNIIQDILAKFLKKSIRPTKLIYLILLPVIFFVFPCFADMFSDDFNGGVDTTIYWKLQINDTLYRMDDSQGNIRFSRSPGGNHVLNTIHLVFQPIVKGDFDVKVDFSNAYIDRLNGTPGNQVQLNSGFGGQALSVVRSDEQNFGHNYHVWIDPPGQWQGYQPNSDSSGTLRITRVGSTVTGYFNSNVIFSNPFNEADVTHLSFSLQNNGTTDSTSVAFDNFTLTADSINLPATGIINSNPKVTGFDLKQNFPNPFNPSTTIEFNLPRDEFVNLRIYNIHGEEVSAPFSKKLNAGKHEYQWNAGDLASGVYIYKLQAGEYTEAKKMILMK